MSRDPGRPLPGWAQTAAPRSDPGGSQAAGAGFLAWIRQPLACGLLLLLSARIPAHLAALATVPARAVGNGPQAAAMALATLLLDGFGVLCAVYLSHARLRGVPLLRCYPPQRLIPLSLHLLGLVWGLLTLAQELAGRDSVR